ncbi:hypothetical protein SDRG_04981, partial [Saprolegnia diclina VS20]
MAWVSPRTDVAATSPRTTLFGTALIPHSNVLPELDSTPRRCLVLHPKVTFQSIGQLSEQQQQLAAIVQASIDDLWNACVNPTAAYAIDLSTYTHLHAVLSRFCGVPSPSHLKDEWASDAQQRSMISLDRFSTLLRQMGEVWRDKLHFSSTATLLSSLVHEVVDFDARCLKPIDQVHTSSTATTFRALLAMRSASGYWDMDSSLAAVLNLDMSQPKTRFQTTEFVFDQLNALGASDAEWTTLRPVTLAWLTQHHVEKHHDEIQALILRLDVRFDVSPLLQSRLEPLDDRARSLTLHALLVMDNDALVHTIEWLRSLSNEIWRVFVSPLGLAGLSAAEPVASYFERLAHFTLSASLYRFLSTLGILEKQELLLFLHTLGPLQYELFLESIQQPAKGRVNGVRSMLSFYFSLSSNARMTLLQELQQILLQQQPPTSVVSTPTTTVVSPIPEQLPPRLLTASTTKTAFAVALGAKPPKLVKPLVERSPAPLPHKRKVRQPGLQPLSTPKPATKSTSHRHRHDAPLSVPKVSVAEYTQNTAWQKALARPKVVLMNGGVYRPTTTTTTQARVKPIDPDRRELEVAYFVTPHVTVQELAFPFPEHCKPRRKPPVALDSVGLSSTWVHRPATRKEHS